MKLAALFGIIALVSCSAGGPKAQVILVEKSQRKMYLYKNNRVVGAYDISLGVNPIGAKEFEGDGRTPEGWYVIDYKNPDSNYHKSLHLSYPNPYDIYKASVFSLHPGNDIVIHALANHLDRKDQIMSIRGWDWTNGCIAVDNESMNRIWNQVDVGTPIFIRP